ncbi:MAG: hypothetical protein WCV73_04520 [Patescibacteria group bacterium]|jgi:hypothetical protein
MKRLLIVLIVIILLIGLAKTNWDPFHRQRDFIVTQHDLNGKTIKCWAIRKGHLTTTDKRLAWTDPLTGAMVELSEQWDFAIVHQENFAEAAKILGVELEKIQNGKYVE